MNQWIGRSQKDGERRTKLMWKKTKAQAPHECSGRALFPYKATNLGVGAAADLLDQTHLRLPKGAAALPEREVAWTTPAVGLIAQSPLRGSAHPSLPIPLSSESPAPSHQFSKLASLNLTAFPPFLLHPLPRKPLPSAAGILTSQWGQ